MSLTDREIRWAKVPKGRNQRDLRDHQVRGLVCRVYKSGVKTWGLAYRRQEDDRRRWLKLGSYPSISLRAARELALQELGRIATGDDPQAEREDVRAAAGGETVAQLAEDYLVRYAKPHKRPKSYQMDEWQIGTYVLPTWGKRAAADITKRDVRDLLEAVADGTLAANGRPTKVAPRNLRALLSKMFDWGAECGRLAGNPAAGVKLPVAVRDHLKKGGRDRVLSDEEIAVLWQQLDRLEEDARMKNQAPVSAAAFRLILLTAQRPGEVFRMRWRDIEDGEWWVIPAEVAKNRESSRVYLSPQARQVLRDLNEHTGGSEWVIESPYRPGRHLTTLKTANTGIVERAGMSPWTPHDLRRTAASKMRALGVDRVVVQAILNHKDRSVTAVYDRYGADPEKRQALTLWGERVEGIVRGQGKGEVLSFRPPISSTGGALLKAAESLSPIVT